MIFAYKSFYAHFALCSETYHNINPDDGTCLYLPQTSKIIPVLPIYNAIAYENRILKGGRTRPIIVTIKDENQDFKQYVVKLYTKEEVERSKTVAKEVITSVLAGEFDLPTPSTAYIRLTDSFLETLPQDLRDEILQKDKRLKFGCEFLSGALNISQNLPKSTLELLQRTDTIFAFDNLVRNFDRRSERTNLLLLNHDIYLIDHEYCLNISQENIDNIEAGLLTSNYKNHALYSFLSSHARKTKESYFDEFFELLRSLDVNALDSYVSQLQSIVLPTPDVLILKEYLLNIKKNSHKFVTLLKGLL